MSYNFLFQKDARLTDARLVNETYLKGLHAVVVGRFIDADDGTPCYALRTFHYAKDDWNGDTDIYSAELVHQHYSTLME